MNTGKLVAAAFVAAAMAAASTGATAQEANASIEACIKLQQKIQALDARRKSGGSAQQMDQWKRQRQVYKDQFTALQCRHWGNRLR